MNYLNFIEKLKEIGEDHPKIKSVLIGDVYELIKNDCNYPCLVINEQSVDIKNNYYNYQLSFIYVDRLTKSGNNLNYIKSDALRSLNDLVNVIRETDDLDCLDEGEDITVTFFKERFEDDCAGAFIEFYAQCTNPQNTQDIIN